MKKEIRRGCNTSADLFEIGIIFFEVSREQYREDPL